MEGAVLTHIFLQLEKTICYKVFKIILSSYFCASFFIYQYVTEKVMRQHCGGTAILD